MIKIIPKPGSTFCSRMTVWPQSYPVFWDAAYGDLNLTVEPFKEFAFGFKNVLHILGMVNLVIIIDEEQGI